MSLNREACYTPEKGKRWLSSFYLPVQKEIGTGSWKCAQVWTHWALRCFEVMIYTLFWPAHSQKVSPHGGLRRLPIQAPTGPSRDAAHRSSTAFRGPVFGRPQRAVESLQVKATGCGGGGMTDVVVCKSRFNILNLNLTLIFDSLNRGEGFFFFNFKA